MRSDDIDIILTATALGRALFSVAHGQHQLLLASRQPFLDAARELVSERWPLTTRLGMRYLGSPHIALRGQLGRVALVAVKEGPNGPPGGCRQPRYRS